MAVRFATSTGNWSNTAIWDNGVLPASDDIVHPNGFTVTLDQDITVGSLRNTISSVYLPDMPIPLMTGNTQPSGEAFAGQNTSTAFQAFNQNTNSLWASTNLTNCFVGYQFPVGKVIKRYYLSRIGESARPITWTFEGSNDGIIYTVLEIVVSNTVATPYLSGVLANTTSYTYYRINVTAVSSGTVANIRALEFTESVNEAEKIEVGVFVRYKNNMAFDECLKTAKSVYEFTFEYDDFLDEYEIASVKKISKAKAKRNKQ
jgi:hypothetical protein